MEILEAFNNVDKCLNFNFIDVKDIDIESIRNVLDSNKVNIRFNKRYKTKFNMLLNSKIDIIQDRLFVLENNQLFLAKSKENFKIDEHEIVLLNNLLVILKKYKKNINRVI